VSCASNTDKNIRERRALKFLGISRYAAGCGKQLP
jgi:hypothetical protein